MNSQPRDFARCNNRTLSNIIMECLLVNCFPMEPAELNIEVPAPDVLAPIGSFFFKKKKSVLGLCAAIYEDIRF